MTLLATLQRKLSQQESAYRHADCDSILSTGVPALDRMLPAGGLRSGSLSEFLTGHGGSGAGTLALVAGKEACRDDRLFVVLDRQRKFHPTAAAAWGFDLERLLLLRPANQADEIWALDQTLRCPGVGAVWVTCGKLDPRDFRRLQLAAECGGTLGLFVRSARQRGSPTWADTQWLVEPQPGQKQWRLNVTLLRCRGGPGNRSVTLELDEHTGSWQEAEHFHATHSLLTPARLAHSTAPGRRARA